MKQINIKKLLLLNLPYLLIGLFATKLGQAWRLAAGVDASTKLLHLPEGFAAAFQSFLPSVHPQDLVIGLICGAALRLAVYVKGKNAKKYRKDIEYGSARWGTAEDIKPLLKSLMRWLPSCRSMTGWRPPTVAVHTTTRLITRWIGATVLSTKLFLWP